MMMTRSRIVAATTADAATLLNSNPMVIVNKQTQSQSHHILLVYAISCVFLSLSL